MNAFIRELFCWHKWKHTGTDRFAINIIYSPVQHYVCEKCGAKKSKASWEK